MLWSLFFKYVVLIAPFLGVSVCNVNTYEKEDNFEHTLNWPKYNRFGQISAVAVDAEGHVYVFHRGNRQWDQYTFKINVFAHKDEGPITMETIVVLDPKDGSLLKKTGANFFYLPHGLTVDDEHNVWVTDVAMHQVFKFPPINFYTKDFVWKPNITLGTFLEPGNDDKHFCKPTGVAVDKDSKDFYVSDGYCNGKIIKYNQSGKKLLHWGIMTNGFPFTLTGYMLSVPHALALAEDTKVLYVADREHFRIVSYDSLSGTFKNVFAQQLSIRIFSVAYFPIADGLLFALTNNGTPSQNTVSVYNAGNGKHLFNLSLKSQLSNPHDLTISPDGNYCYIVELNPYKIWKIKIDKNKTLSMLHSSLTEKKKKAEASEEVIPVQSESKNMEVGNSFLAMGLVISIVVISFLFFMFHYYKRNGHMRYETRRLILDDDENGIQLT